MTSSIKKSINTELFIDSNKGLYIQQGDKDRINKTSIDKTIMKKICINARKLKRLHFFDMSLGFSLILLISSSLAISAFGSAPPDAPHSLLVAAILF